MKKKMAVYHYSWLPLSETFIHRQVLGLNRDFDVRLLTDSIVNERAFAGADPILVPGEKFLGRLLFARDRFFRAQLAGCSLFHVNFGHIAVEMQRHARNSGLPMTVFFHGVDASSLLRNQAYCESLKNSIFAAYIVCSHDMATRLRPYLPQGAKVFVSYCGIRLDLIPYRRRTCVPEGALFLQVSRLSSKKGVDISLKAFRNYLDEVDSRARFVIAGDGPLMDSLKALAHTLGLDGQVFFTGALPYAEVIKLLGEADVFLHPSVTDKAGDMEGIPNTIAEAMAAGLPVIATRHSGIPELIEDAKSGILVAENDAEELFAAMSVLRRAEVGTLSQRARERVDRMFNYEQTTSDLAGYLRDIVR